MKTLKQLLYLILGLILTSCTFTEEISFNKDGSGKFNTRMDMSGMINMMESIDQDSTKANNKALKEVKDSIINFDDILDQYKDSIQKMSKSEQQTLEALKGIKMRMFMDENKNEMFIDFFKNFNNITELKDIQKQLKLAQQINNSKSANNTPDIENHEISYSFSNKKFKRTVTKLKLSAEEQKKFDKQIEKMKMFMAQSHYIIKYSFPNKIKSTNLKGAKISDDGHLLEYNVYIETLIDNPEILDFEVKF